MHAEKPHRILLPVTRVLHGRDWYKKSSEYKTGAQKG